MLRSQCRHVDEQYRQHLESEHDDGRNCAVEHSQTLSLSQSHSSYHTDAHAREAVKPQDILLGDGAQKEFESEEEHSAFNPHLHWSMWSQASVQGRGRA